MTVPSLHSRGFTLIELLVVMVIIGITVSFAVLSLGDGGKRDKLQEEGRRLVALIELASDSAVLEGREWGLRVEPDGYRFMVLVEGAWQPASGDRLFRPRQLAKGFSLALHVDDIEVALLQEEPGDETPPGDAAREQPQLFLMSSAERTPFEIILTAPDGEPQMAIEAPLMGAVVLHEPHAR